MGKTRAPTRRERVGGDASGWRVHRLSRLECPREGRGQLGLDADDAHPVREPCGDAADETPAPHRSEDRVERARLLLQLETQGAGARILRCSCTCQAEVASTN